ncbi:FUSC family protein [Peptoniphilus sp. MSJ-1]|uniref:FUSC family protein n=1 Tax=Peptoniphilus ovalis TaxID=2841503 RepID=A0ABS6FF06_9FIRM|nr:aromatic acid exporter family protein [Peptoniphilus ovalis]MBU5668554.1 FUSC family protein [Peptoniphilus ovalis]
MKLKKRFNYKYRIGMRAIKTALAVVVGLYISELLNLDSPIFVSIAAVSSMKPSISESLQDTRKRLFTSVFGVILGYLSSKISVPLFVEPLIAGIGILITIYILSVVKMRDMTQLSCIVFVASFCSDSDKAVYAFNRVIGTFIGILVAVLVNYLVSSPDIWNDFLAASKKAYINANRALKSILVDESDGLAEFNENLESCNTLYKLLLEEVKTPFHHEHSLVKEKEIMSLLESISVRLEVVNNMSAKILKNEIIEEIEDRYGNEDAEEIEDRFYLDNGFRTPTEVDSVYNYHIKYILKYLDELKVLVGEKR